MIPGSWLRKPDIAGIPGKLAAFQRPRDRVAVADLAAGGVDDVGAALHLGDQGVVEEVLGLGMERRVDRDHVADRHQRLGVWVVGHAELALNRLSTAEPIRPAATVPTCIPSRSYDLATQSAMFQPPLTTH